MPKTIPSFMKYFAGDVVVNGTIYQDLTPAIMLTSENGEPVTKATSNLAMHHDIELEENTVAIKDYSENSGVLITLIVGKIVTPCNEVLSNAYGTNWVVAKIIDPTILNEIQEALNRVS